MKAEYLVSDYRGEPTGDPPAEAFIQWKGTDVCFDFWCPCGGGGHFDGYFAYTVKCSDCGAVYEMPSHVYPRRIEPNDNANPVKPISEDA